MNLQEKLAQKRKSDQENIPPKYLKVLKTSIRDLVRSGIRDKVLKPGDALPDFELKNQNGNIVKSSELISNSPLVITFYRGFWCPYCNYDLANLNHYLPRIKEAGANSIAISPEQAMFSKKIIVMQKLNFDILWDQGNKLADAFGLKFNLSQDMLNLYRNKLHVNLKMYHGDDEWSLPIPARFLVNTDGIITYAESSPDYTKRPDLDDIMTLLES